ncbi:hypothetical protein BAUCODRAFT_32744 [Baudoinia panamericana UAMH 10762]|uniref:Inositol polyphosphate-related phosphatase domain-containing protein n=1 Tax=Baudoinia panamericana (strain UAMH 10762) TaxID=717646 RepID=M2MZH8_BAUPA|nr:uncharacterized protein BAUCODRAFT_32744 [Baudoinia panamericana UAMH 10762]EMC96998.1 hypothetical protein BAUCODRAFT_32744 [Baudoinia panamericana UAMH 10762]
MARRSQDTAITRSRTTSASTTGSLMQDVPGAWPSRTSTEEQPRSDWASLSQALHARRAEYVRQKQVRIKVGTWNVAAYKGTVKDLAGWFVEGKGVTEALAGLTVNDQTQSHGHDVPVHSGLDEREDVAAQEARYARKQSTLPRNDPGSLPGNDDIGLYVLGLQEVVDINSFTEALRPFTDPVIANKWKDAVATALPAGYTLVAEQQLIGMLLLIFASPDLAKDVRSVSTTSVGTGIAGYMGNKGAVTARIILGETTRLVFINCHLSAGADPGALERRNWDAAQIVARTRFAPITDAMELQQTTGEQIGDEDFAFWCGDLNYRLEGIPGDDVRRLLMLHTRNEYDLSQRSAQKIENELQSATASVKRRVEDRLSISSTTSNESRLSTDSRTRHASTPPTIVDEIAASEDPTSLQTTISSLLPHDELIQQMKARKAFHDGWREGPINFLPTYKYDAGSVGVFDSSEKKRAPSWCDRILYRTRRDRLAYEAKIRDEELARQRDEEMRANGTDQAGQDEEILYDYDPDTDGAEANDEYDEHDDDGANRVVTNAGFEDEIVLEYYTAHQRVLSSDHKPLDAVFKLRYDCVIPELKAKVHAEVAKELDKEENESRPSVTVVVDKHRDSMEQSDEDPATFEGVWLGNVKYAVGKHRSLTVANTGRVPATFRFIERPVAGTAHTGVAPKWVNLTIDGVETASSSKSTEPITLEPGDTCAVELEVRIWDVNTSHDLNEGLLELDDILVLRVDGGRDHFIPIRGNWLANSLGRSIGRLTRIPEGGIRKLQRQRPDSSKKSPTSPASSKSVSPTLLKFPPSALDSLPVSAAAPRLLPLLTRAIEELSIQVVAEWDMTHSAGDNATAEESIPPWKRYPSWPFDKACWTERDTQQWQEAVGDACNAMDSDQPVEASLPLELPRLQRLYVLAATLMLFLEQLPDGVVDAELWSRIDAHMAHAEKLKTKPSVDDRRLAVLEIMAQIPSHSVCLILITSMIERVVQETAAPQRPEEHTQSSPRRPGGSLRRMTGLGRLPAAADGEPASHAIARVFASVVVKAPAPSSERAKVLQEKRRTEMLELFLRKDEPG